MRVNPSTQIRITWFVVLVLLIWYLLGWVMPIILFSDYKTSGGFGDSFGAVNSLFSALGFVAIAVTIYLQIEVIKEQRALNRFEFYLKLFDDIKNDLNSFRFGEISGFQAIDSLKNHLKKHVSIVEEGRYNHSLVYVHTVNEQMIYLIRLIRKSKIKDEEQIGAIHSKILLLFFSYLDKLCADVRNVEMKNKYF